MKERTPGIAKLIPGNNPGPTGPPVKPPPTRRSAPEKGALRVSGRVGHDEKVTVYLSTEELVALDAFRLGMRTAGYRVDRGRVLREAAALALAMQDELADRCKEER